MLHSKDVSRCRHPFEAKQKWVFFKSYCQSLSVYTSDWKISKGLYYEFQNNSVLPSYITILLLGGKHDNFTLITTGYDYQINELIWLIIYPKIAPTQQFWNW